MSKQKYACDNFETSENVWIVSVAETNDSESEAVLAEARSVCARLEELREREQLEREIKRLNGRVAILGAHMNGMRQSDGGGQEGERSGVHGMGA